MGPLDQARIRSLASLLIGTINPGRQIFSKTTTGSRVGLRRVRPELLGFLDHHSLRLDLALIILMSLLEILLVVHCQQLLVIGILGWLPPAVHLFPEQVDRFLQYILNSVALNPAVSSNSLNLSLALQPFGAFPDAGTTSPP
jgi:hypothetical protein